MGFSSTIRGTPGPVATRAFGEFLVAEGSLQAETLRRALKTQSAAGGRLDTVLLDQRLVPESVLLDALGRFHASRTVSSAELAVIPPEVIKMVSPRMAVRLGIVPFRLDGRTLCVATLDPGDLLVEDELSLLTDCMISSFVALEVRLREAVWRLYGVEPPIQIASILKRFAAGPVDPDRTMAGWRPAAGLPAAARTTAPGGRAPDAAGSDLPPDAIALEISDEELDQFPSLREGLEEAGPAPRRGPARPAETSSPADPDRRFEDVTTAFQNAEMREDIADAVLGFCQPILRRRMLLFVRNDAVIGWRGEGEGMKEPLVRQISIPLAEPSVFVGLSQGAEFWLGPLPRMPRNQDLVRGLGGVPPAECIILPLIVRGKTVCFLYGDNVDQPASGLPISQLRRLVAKASLAFQVYILKSKIRNL